MKPFPSAPIRCSLISLFVFLVGVFLALLGFGEFSVQAQQRPQVIMQSTDPLVPVGFDCSGFVSWGSINKKICGPEQS